ncbi:NUDIX hydrolase [Lentibacillus daqui]|uniref:NUDIX hydrolase n=1 Tax=Lentibacillus daqui TaxID=2911514 RepID=UPI0022B0FF68|nr:CoA pyrophosphatase [Lentibacillus daqui]
MNLTDIIAKLNGRKPTILGYDNFHKHAILLPLIEKNNEVHILFEVRSMKLRSQPGDICFPGGKIDPTDPDPEYCAIRETTDELGISKTSIENISPLDYIVADNGRMIFPFTGTIKNAEQINPSQAEVGEIFTVPLSYFLQVKPEIYKVYFKVIPADDFPFDLIVGGEDYNWQVRHKDELFYQYNGKVIWGLTARILYHFLHLIDS